MRCHFVIGFQLSASGFPPGGGGAEYAAFVHCGIVSPPSVGQLNYYLFSGWLKRAFILPLISIPEIAAAPVSSECI